MLDYQKSVRFSYLVCIQFVVMGCLDRRIWRTFSFV
jgi:hypothetical protein